MRAKKHCGVGLAVAVTVLLATAGAWAQSAAPAGQTLPVFRELERIASDPAAQKSERLSAIDGLGRGAHPSVVPTLLAVSQDPDPEIRASAVSALGWAGNRAALAALLARASAADEAPPVRKAAIAALGRIGDPAAAAPLEALAKDPAPPVRQEALSVLMNSALSRATDRVAAAIALLGDLEQDGYTRSKATRVLALAKDARAVEPLLKILQDARAPAGYEELPNPEALQGRARIMAERLRSLHDVRAHAAYALGALGARRAIPALLDGLDDLDHQVRIQSAGALGLLRAREAVSKLVEALEDPVERVQINAATALGLIGDRAAGPPLIRALAGSDPQVRERAAEALGRLRDPAARPALQRLADEDESAAVRQAAHGALRQLDRATAAPKE